MLQWAEGIIGGAIFFAGGAVEPHAVFRQHRVHAVRKYFLRHGFGGAKPGAAADSNCPFHAQSSIPARRACSNGFLQNVPFLLPDARALAVKDLRMFWRDTTQWGQSVMFFGLLGAYIINLRNFTHQLTSPFWIHAVAFLNLGACAFNLASVTTRFVFPQFSLEGRRLWIIGLAPIGLPRVVKTKYWLASAASLVVTLGLVTLSCYLLQNAVGRRRFFRRGHHRDDLRAQRPRHRPRRFVSEPEGNQSEQNRQRLRRDAVFRAEFGLYHRARWRCSCWAAAGCMATPTGPPPASSALSCCPWPSAGCR